MTTLEIVLTVVAGVFTGIVSAVFGGGGGQVSIPFMILALGLSQHTAEGTSLMVIVPTAAIGALVHSRAGYVRWRPALWLGAAGAMGAAVGALLAVRTDELILRRTYAAFVLFVAFRFLRPRRHGPEDARSGEATVEEADGSAA